MDKSIAAALMLFTSLTGSPATSPREVVQAAVDRVVAVLEGSEAGRDRGERVEPRVPSEARPRAEIRKIAVELFDFDEMARRALGQHWKDRSPQEQAEFVPLFVNLLERSYLTAIGNYPLSTITFQSENVNGAHADVRSRIVTDRREVPVEYRLLKIGGRWAVYDVVADGVSLISSYRSQFNSIIRTSSFAQLMERLRSREANVGPRQGP